MSPVELPTITVTAPPPMPAGDRDRLVRRVKALSWFSLGWMTVEAVVGISAAAAAGSVALLGFGLDSVIEALASVIVIWRFTGQRRLSDHGEQRAQQAVAVSFFLLAPYVAQDAVRTLLTGEHPGTSWVGIVLSISSVILMPALARAKQRLGSQLGSAATAGEGTQNQLCAYLAAGVLAGLALNAALGWWWADPVVALAIATVAVKEGRETWRGDGCCAPSPLIPGGDGCDDTCCTG
jgi:divalent metal cation (Fe/Co/Zn/Cd) transporter